MPKQVDAKGATELLRLIGYDDEQITAAVSQKFQMTRAKACDVLEQVDELAPPDAKV